MPKISVIVPVYNVEQYLHRCVDSILAQTFTDFELILVDDGSPDNCPSICDEYAKKDNRVVVIHQNNGGLSAARNAGIDWSFANSDSEWITFIDSDDWVHKQYLKALLYALQTHDTTLAMCKIIQTNNYDIEDIGVDYTSIEKLSSENAYVSYYLECMSACGKLFNKEYFSSLRFPLDKLHEDSFVTHIPIFSANQISIVSIPMYNYFINEKSITHSIWSVKRLDEIEGHKTRIDYLSKNGFDRALEKEVFVFCHNLVFQLDSINKLPTNHYKYIRNIKKELRHLLKKYKNNNKIRSNMRYFKEKLSLFYIIIYSLKDLFIQKRVV